MLNIAPTQSLMSISWARRKLILNRENNPYNKQKKLDVIVVLGLQEPCWCREDEKGEGGEKREGGVDRYVGKTDRSRDTMVIIAVLFLYPSSRSDRIKLRLYFCFSKLIATVYIVYEVQGEIAAWFNTSFFCFFLFLFLFFTVIVHFCLLVRLWLLVSRSIINGHDAVKMNKVAQKRLFWYHHIPVRLLWHVKN